MNEFLNKTGLAHFWGKVKEAINSIGHIIEQNKSKQQKFWRGTKSEFDAIETKDENTLYIVTDEESGESADYATKTDLSTHTDDTDIHVTTEEKDAWDAKADASKYVSVTLAAASWDSTAKTQTVTVTGVSATETAQMITPTPALSSQTAYYDAGVLCTGQATDSLTFTCKTVPTADLTVYVVIQEVAHG